MGKRRNVGIRRLKNETSRIVDEVHERGTDYIVTKRGKPVAVIRPWGAEDSRELRKHDAARALERLARVAGRVAEAAKSTGRVAGAASAVSQQRR